MATHAKERASKEEVSKSAVLLTGADIWIETGLPAKEVDRRLVSLARADRQVEAALCFYLQEVDRRQLYREYGHASTEAYARERLGIQDRKTRSLLFMAHRMDELPRMKEEFKAGNIPWTKAREAVKVATKETEDDWLEKVRKLSNRQLEDEVRQSLPPVKKKTLVFTLTDDFLEVWEQAREACE